MTREGPQGDSDRLNMQVYHHVIVHYKTIVTVFSALCIYIDNLLESIYIYI